MFAVEFTSYRPSGAAPYYSLVIREDPYTVGCLPISDVCLPCHDVSPQHALLEVLRERTAVRAGADAHPDDVRSEYELVDPALEEPTVVGQGRGGSKGIAAEANNDGNVVVAAEEDGYTPYHPEGEEVSMIAGEDTMALAAARPAGSVGNGRAHTQPVTLTEEDPLVVRLTALPTKGAGAIVVDGHELGPGEAVLLRSGAEVQLSGEVLVILRFRPLVVSIEPTAFTAAYTRDLVYMFRRLGATLCNVASGPTPNLEDIPTPIGLLHCTEELSSSRSCVVALACGYSVVQPTYVFEWFASLAQAPSQPLSVLPAPSRFEVPLRTTVRPRSAMYVRPESDTCPYSLYPIPGTAMRRRNRAELFLDKTFFFASRASAETYMETVAQCGGAVLGPDEAHRVRLALREMVAGQRNPNMNLSPSDEERPYPANFYIIVDAAIEASMLRDGLRRADRELCQLMEDANSLGATHVPVMSDHSLFTSLLSNAFSYEPVRYSVDPPFTPPAPVPATDAGAYPPYSAEAAYLGAPPRTSSTAAPAPYVNGICPTRGSPRRASLLPRDRDRTPTRSQLRSASRQRARSTSVATSDMDGQGSVHGATPRPTRSASRGRRQLIPTERHSLGGAPATSLTVGERFDILRIRVYAFLMKEEPRLEMALHMYQRTRYVDSAVVERTLEVRAQAEEYMQQVDDLLDEGGYSPYADSLRRFWADCSDLSAKAAQVLRTFDGQGRGRRSLRERAPSTQDSPRGSLARAGNGIFERGEHGAGGAPPVVPAVDTAALPRGGTSSRPHTPRVREHRDAYLGVHRQQRPSLSASRQGSLSASTGLVASPRGGAAVGGPAAHLTSAAPSFGAMDTVGDVDPARAAPPSAHEDGNGNGNGSATARGGGPCLGLPGTASTDPAHRCSESSRPAHVSRSLTHERGEAPASTAPPASAGRRGNGSGTSAGNPSATTLTGEWAEGLNGGIRRAPPRKSSAQATSTPRGRPAVHVERVAWQS